MGWRLQILDRNYFWKGLLLGEEQPHVQSAVAAWAQEGREELLHVQGQEGWLWGDTPHPR